MASIFYLLSSLLSLSNGIYIKEILDLVGKTMPLWGCLSPQSSQISHDRALSSFLLRLIPCNYFFTVLLGDRSDWLFNVGGYATSLSISLNCRIQPAPPLA